jgi:hypothetical protein
MPHEFESGVFTEGRPAWHVLGTVLPNDSLDSAEALTYSGLAGWQLTKQQAFAEAQGRPGSENANLFPPNLADWAQAHSDELAIVELELRDR